MKAMYLMTDYMRLSTRKDLCFPLPPCIAENSDLLFHRKSKQNIGNLQSDQK